MRRYPDDPELWYMLGDARFHAGALAGVTARASLDAFDRAIALDSAFTPSYVHAVPLGLEYGGTAAGRRYAQAFLAAGAMGSYAQSSDLIIRLIDPSTRAAAIRYLADSADNHLFQTVWLALGRWIDSSETVVALMRARAEAEQKAGKPGNPGVFGLPVALAARGHVKEAAQKTAINVLLAQYALVGGISPDSATRLARSWVAKPADGMLYAAALLAAAHDTATLAAELKRLEAARLHPPANAPPIASDFRSYLMVASRAFLALARGDSAEALRLFDARPDTACFGQCMIDDLVHIQLLVARGRLNDAAARLERPAVGFTPGVFPVEVLRALERGRVNERLGNRGRAIEGYTLVVDAWRNPDRDLLPFVNEARAALARLNTEPRKGS